VAFVERFHRLTLTVQLVCDRCFYMMLILYYLTLMN